MHNTRTGNADSTTQKISHARQGLRSRPRTRRSRRSCRYPPSRTSTMIRFQPTHGSDIHVWVERPCEKSFSPYTVLFPERLHPASKQSPRLAQRQSADPTPGPGPKLRVRLSLVAPGYGVPDVIAPRVLGNKRRRNADDRLHQTTSSERKGCGFSGTNDWGNTPSHERDQKSICPSVNDQTKPRLHEWQNPQPSRHA